MKQVTSFWFAVLEDVLGPRGPLGRIWWSAAHDDWQQLIDDDAAADVADPELSAGTGKPADAVGGGS